VLVEGGRVVFFNPWDRFIGPNRYLATMLEKLPRLASFSTVVFDTESEAIGEYRDMGCRVVTTRLASQVRAKPSLRNLFEVLSRHLGGRAPFTKLMARENPALLVSNTEQLFLGSFAARRLRIPHLKIFHALTFAYRFGKHPALLAQYLRLLTWGCDRVVAVSETMRRLLVQGGVEPRRVVTIPNPIGVTSLRTAAEAALPDEIAQLIAGRYPVLLTAGVLFPTKGQDRLVEALPRIREKYPEVLCLFAGRIGNEDGFSRTGDYYQRIRSRMVEHDLESVVAFLGDVSFLPALMRRADIYIQPSRTESFGRAAAEALVCGAPAVVFDAGALAETVGPGGVVVPDGDLAALSQAVIDLAWDEERRRTLALAGAEHIARNYEASTVAEQFEKLITELVG